MEIFQMFQDIKSTTKIKRTYFGRQWARIKVKEKITITLDIYLENIIGIWK
ncbi:hypothetical protein RS9916_38677 [Synechococcus sp. RS9916]|nr:hypothetical protein RS9916_38677 [Synechococcus sp. RS9916]